jgi:hypothetical protein
MKALKFLTAVYSLFVVALIAYMAIDTKDAYIITWCGVCSGIALVYNFFIIDCKKWRDYDKLHGGGYGFFLSFITSIFIGLIFGWIADAWSWLCLLGLVPVGWQLFYSLYLRNNIKRT